MAELLAAGAVVSPISCVVPTRLARQALLALVRNVRHSEFQLNSSGHAIWGMGDLRICSLPTNRLLVWRWGTGHGPALVLRTPDDFLGPADPVAILRSWLASVRVAVPAVEAEGLRLLGKPRRCASLLAAMAAAAGLEGVRAGCFSSPPYPSGYRFVLSASGRRLRLPNSLHSYLDDEGPAFRYLASGRDSKFAARRIYALVTPACLGPVEVLRLIGQLPLKLIDDLRRSVSQEHAP